MSHDGAKLLPYYRDIGNVTLLLMDYSKILALTFIKGKTIVFVRKLIFLMRKKHFHKNMLKLLATMSLVL